MSKELEALKLIGYVNYEDSEGYETFMETYFKKEFELIKKALTPPTEQEVCEEIGYYFYKCVGWMNVHVEYDKVNKSFIVEHDDKKQTYCELIENIQTIQFYTDIPIFIAEHIAQFFKSLKEAQE
jgi:hypothetical protein